MPAKKSPPEQKLRKFGGGQEGGKKFRKRSRHFDPALRHFLAKCRHRFQIRAASTGSLVDNVRRPYFSFFEKTRAPSAVGWQPIGWPQSENPEGNSRWRSLVAYA